MTASATDGQARVLAETRRWLETAVIGLNLCPFARAVHTRGLIRWVVTEVGDATALQRVLADELQLLADTPATAIDTTLLIHPNVLSDFSDYNAFLDRADRTLIRMKLVGRLQVASFHPRYRFARSAADAIENCSNRSPHPMLHLLREASVEHAVAAYGDTSAIYRNNVARLRTLGPAGWVALWTTSTEPAPAAAPDGPQHDVQEPAIRRATD